VCRRLLAARHFVRVVARGAGELTGAAQEALRLASTEDDLYAARINMGQTREKIEDEAEHFFARLVPDGDARHGRATRRTGADAAHCAEKAG
jgi:hypothetical protein